jgi:phosphate/phosphite/phosphonate ABC transporter binding protein
MPLARTIIVGMSRSNNAEWPGLLARGLAAALGSAVEGKVTEDYDQLLQKVLASDVDVAWLPPLLHARAAEQGAKLVALPQRGGWLTFRSAILVRKDDPVTEISGLHGVRAAWRDKSSASGYLFPRLELAARGAPPEQAFSSEKFYGSVLQAAHAVAKGEADLCTCFVSDAARDPERAVAEVSHALGQTAENLRVLHVTDPIPPDGFVVAAGVTDDERAVITTALLGMHGTAEGKKALEAILQAERLAPVNDALLLSLRSWAESAAARG